MLNQIGLAVVTVSDINRSLEFYRDLLNFPVKVETPDWVEFDLPGGGLALHAGGEVVEMSARTAGRVGFSVQVEDVNQAYEELREQGIEFIMAPTRQDFGVTMAVFQDPDGVNWHLVQPDS